MTTETTIKTCSNDAEHCIAAESGIGCERHQHTSIEQTHPYDEQPSDETIVWKRSSDGDYRAEINGVEVGHIFRGGVGGYRWSWYAGVKHGESTTVGSAKESIGRVYGIEPAPVDFAKIDAKNAARHAKMLADSRARAKSSDVISLHRAAYVLREHGRVDLAVTLLDLADEIESATE